MKQFKSSVPADVKMKLSQLALLALESFGDMVTGRHEAYGEVTLGDIEGNFVSGWIPRQDGGYSIDKLYASGIDTGHFTEKHTAFINDQVKACQDAFSLTDEDDEEEYSQYENDWFADGAMLQFQMFAEGFDKEVVFKDREAVVIRISINYSDAPYFREKGGEDIKMTSYDVDEFLDTSNEEIIKSFTI